MINTQILPNKVLLEEYKLCTVEWVLSKVELPENRKEYFSLVTDEILRRMEAKQNDKVY